MVIPKTPISLEKNPDTDDPFFIHNDHHIIDTSESFAFPLLHIDFNFPSRDSEMFLTRSARPSFFLPRRIFLEFPGLFPNLWEPHESLEFYIPSIHATPPSLYSFGLSIFDGFIHGPFETPKVAKEKDVDSIRNKMISLYHEFRVFYLRYSPLLNFQNEYHSEHKKLSRYCPSHFWQVLE